MKPAGTPLLSVLARHPATRETCWAVRRSTGNAADLGPWPPSAADPGALAVHYPTRRGVASRWREPVSSNGRCFRRLRKGVYRTSSHSSSSERVPRPLRASGALLVGRARDCLDDEPHLGRPTEPAIGLQTQHPGLALHSALQGTEARDDALRGSCGPVLGRVAARGVGRDVDQSRVVL